MIDSSSPSRDHLRQRRKSLRQRRRIRLGQVAWQLLAISGLTTAMFWGVTRPIWLIHRADQIAIDGNELMSDQTIRALVPLTYPQSLLQVQPNAIAQALLSRAPLQQVQVRRQLFPPQLIITVQERQPVAHTLPVTTADQRRPAGFLDAEGAWIPSSSFTVPQQAAHAVHLTIRGFHPQYQDHWPQMLLDIQASPVAITAVDWRDPSNLKLQTDLGIVHLGPYGTGFEQQLQALAHLHHLPTQLDGQAVAHIDLSNPQMPSVAMQPPSTTSQAE